MKERFEDPTLEGNQRIAEQIHRFCQEPNSRNLTAVCMAIRQQITRNRHFIFPADPVEGPNGEMGYDFKTLERHDMRLLAAFTSPEELRKGPEVGAVSHFIDTVLDSLLETEGIDGLLLNPWGEWIILDKEDIVWIRNRGIERILGDVSPVP